VAFRWLVDRSCELSALLQLPRNQANTSQRLRLVAGSRGLFNPSRLEQYSKNTCHLLDDEGLVQKKIGQQALECCQQVLRKHTRCRHRHPGTDVDIAQIDTIRITLRAVVTKLSTDEWGTSKKEYSAFRDQALLGGARVAHQITKLAPSVPVDIHRPNFIEEVETEELKWHSLWKTQSTPTDFSTNSVAQGRRFTPAKIAHAASTFAFGTSCLDGIPIKCISLCTTSLLEALSLLYHISMFFAYYPPDMGSMVVKLIDKKDATFRPIVLFRSLYRLHGRLLAESTREWERHALANTPFANNQGRETLDSTFRCWVRQAIQLTTGSAASAADILIDLRKCFEYLSRELLWKSCVDHGFPLHAVRLSMQTYAWPRYILGAYDYVGKTVTAARGIAAGSPFATTELKVYLLKLARSIQIASGPKVSLSIFVDDFSISTAQTTDEQTAKVITDAYQLTIKGLRDLDLIVAPDKTELVASSQEVRELIRIVIPTCNRDNHCRKLGVDVNYSAGRISKTSKGIRRRRPLWFQPVRKDRNRTFLARHQKCRRMLSGASYRRVHRAGLVTGALFGTEVAPIDEAQLSRMQTASVRAEGIMSSGTPRCMYWLCMGAKADPAFIAYSKPIIRIAREIWLISQIVQSKSHHQDSLSAIEIHNLMNSVFSEQNESMLLNWIHTCFTKFGISIGKHALSWQFGATTFDMTVTTKAQITDALAKIWNEKTMRTVCTHLDVPAFDSSIIQKEYARFSVNKRRLLVQLLSNTVYTFSHAHKIGAQTSPQCPTCGAAKDTATHRLFECGPNPRMSNPQEGVPLQKQLLWRPPPALPLKSPRVSTFWYYEIHYFKGKCTFHSVAPFHMPCDAEFFTDGSCRGSPTSRVMASGAAAYLHSGEQNNGIYRAVTWAVPEDLPQSSFTGEFLGLRLLLTGVTMVTHMPPIKVITDSSALLHGWARATLKGPSFGRKWDGLYKQAISMGITGQIVSAVALHKVKAHQHIRDDLSDQQQRWIHGNAVADAVANKCIDNHVHDQYFDEEAIALKQHRTFIRKSVQALLDARADMGKAPKPKRTMNQWRAASVKAGNSQHSLAWTGHKFACKTCFQKFARLPSISHTCTGVPRAGIGAISTATQHGHKPIVACIEGPKHGLIIACIKCGAYSADRIALLAKPCTGKLGLRKYPIIRLSRGRHPYCKASRVTRTWQPGFSNDGNALLVACSPSTIAANSTGALSDRTLPAPPPISEVDDEWDLHGLADFFGANGDG
jgi:ribonuclease HI